MSNKNYNRIMQWAQECERRAIEENKLSQMKPGYIPRIIGGKATVAKAMGMTLRQLDRYTSR